MRKAKAIVEALRKARNMKVFVNGQECGTFDSVSQYNQILDDFVLNKDFFDLINLKDVVPVNINSIKKYLIKEDDANVEVTIGYDDGVQITLVGNKENLIEYISQDVDYGCLLNAVDREYIYSCGEDTLLGINTQKIDFVKGKGILKAMFINLSNHVSLESYCKPLCYMIPCFVVNENNIRMGAMDGLTGRLYNIVTGDISNCLTKKEIQRIKMWCKSYHEIYEETKCIIANMVNI